MLSAMLDKTGTLQVDTASKDAAGGVTSSYSASYSNVACAVWPKGSGPSSEFQRTDMLGTHVIATDTDYGAKANDRWLISGVYYLVLGVEPFSNSAVTTENLFLHNCTLRTV